MGYARFAEGSRTALVVLGLVVAMLLGNAGAAGAATPGPSLTVVHREASTIGDYTFPAGYYIEAYSPRLSRDTTFRIRLYHDAPSAESGYEDNHLAETTCAAGMTFRSYLAPNDEERDNGDWYARLIIYTGKNSDTACKSNAAPSSYSETTHIVVEGCPDVCAVKSTDGGTVAPPPSEPTNPGKGFGRK